MLYALPRTNLYTSAKLTTDTRFLQETSACDINPLITWLVVQWINKQFMDLKQIAIRGMDAMLSVNYDALINTPSHVKLRYLKICGGTLRYANVKLFNV